MLTSMEAASKLVELPADIANYVFPAGLDRRLQFLLDKQDGGEVLTEDEQAEAEGIVELDALLRLLRLRAG